MSAPKQPEQPLRHEPARRCRVCGQRLVSLSVKAVECKACQGTQSNRSKLRNVRER